MRLQGRSNNYGNRRFCALSTALFLTARKIPRNEARENIEQELRKEGRKPTPGISEGHAENVSFLPSLDLSPYFSSSSSFFSSITIESTITRGRIITAITNRGVTDCRNKHKPAPLSDPRLSIRTPRRAGGPVVAYRTVAARRSVRCV